ncbi:Cellulase (glycosyl hydrolase family 5 protein) [Rhizoctonia solani]|uniref:Cellulase (Glycosyl hydrolase family 5 protein) n=1 Tax=Rhizoctonia solani TaxID=456999 RepID=A0A8H8T146_9AGAM|nr:Cellulase (glycosyl hydrolase family 5 protein) [Rhizoctonia solani]QRW25424.1 Cellulase (glycosyl hydrolase family 5 protein) [Rhizoctonia solani]
MRVDPTVEDLEELDGVTAPLYFGEPISDDEPEPEHEHPTPTPFVPRPLPDADGSGTEDEDEMIKTQRGDDTDSNAARRISFEIRWTVSGVRKRERDKLSTVEMRTVSDPSCAPCRCSVAAPSVPVECEIEHDDVSSAGVGAGGRSISQPQVAGSKRPTGSGSDSEDEFEREELLPGQAGAKFIQEAPAPRSSKPTGICLMHINRIAGPCARGSGSSSPSWGRSVWLLLAEAKPKQCRVVNKKREAQQAHAQNPFPPTSTSPLSPSGTASASASAYPSPTAFDYSKDKIRGVNLGGWLLLEPWITPSLFENTGNEQIVDEYTFNTLQDAATVRRILREHWETWIVEDDFRKIAEAGLNHVRLPFGYWSVPRPGNDPTPYNPDAWPYVMKAIDWARKYNLFVIMDIHGAPGSQNGYDNSGQRMNMPQWHTSAAYVNQTLDVVAWLAQTFGGPEYENLVTMIQLMNEPAGFYPEVLSVMRDYYQRSYWIIRPISNHLLVALHDGFQPLSIWSTRTNVPSPENTIMDTHIYQIFNDAQVTMSWDAKLKATCDQGNTLASYTAREDGFRTYVGEWTTSYTDCAKWLNGRGVGARLDGTRAGSSFLRTCEDITGTMDKFSESYKTWLRRYWDAQTIAFERGNGWVYWTWKTEIADEWSYSKGLEGGWIPQDPTNHIYNAC